MSSWDSSRKRPIYNPSMDMIQTLQNYIYAERAGLWKLHLQQARLMLQYMAVSGHHNYVSCLPQYLNEMENLINAAPEVYQQFTQGKFGVHCTAGKFNAVWTDMALEQTYNCEGKTVLFYGTTQQQAAMDKYIKALPVLTAISEGAKKWLTSLLLKKNIEIKPSVTLKLSKS